MRRLLASISIIVLISTAFISGYFRFDRIVVFADSVPDGYTQITSTSDQVKAFQYYCKSRNLAIEGSVLDAVTHVTTKAYQAAVQGAGLNINQIQSELYKSTTPGQSFFYTVSGVTAMNRIFAEFLQNNNLAVGDTDVNKQIYNGRLFVDADGIATECSIDGAQTLNYYKYSPDDIQAMSNGSQIVFHTTDSQTISGVIDNNGGSGVYRDELKINAVINGITYLMYQKPANAYQGATSSYESHFCVSFYPSSNELWLGYCKVYYYPEKPTIRGAYTFNKVQQIVNGQSQNATVYIVSTQINNNNYEGDTIINNNGDIVNPTPQPTPIPDPNDDHTTVTNPVQPDSPDSDSNLTFPLIDLDIPSIDWSLGDLSDKFPFSIPFDLIAFFTVLNAEPQTPELQGEIDLGIVSWVIDWDLSDFDNIATILRNLEFIGFCIGLILITRSLIKG